MKLSVMITAMMYHGLYIQCEVKSIYGANYFEGIIVEF